MADKVFNKDEQGIIEPTLKDFAFYQLDFSVLSTARLRELADHALDEASPHWHTGLAWIYMEAGYNDDAIHHFKETLAIEPQAWLPKEGLARVYGGQERYSEAIQLMEESYSSLPENFAYLGGFLLPHIAGWKEIIGDTEGAYETARQGYIAEPSSHLAQDRYLRALDQKGDSSSFINVLSYMQQQIWLDSQTSYLARLLNYGYDIFDEIGRAFRTEKRPQFVLEEMEKVLIAALTSKDPWMKIWLQGEVGMFRYQYNDENDDAMKLLEQALKTLTNAGPKAQEENAWARKRYGHLLARLYFDSAVSARKNGTNAWPYTKRLKQLATVTNMANEESVDFFDFYGPGYASMLWGCWLRTYERAEEGMWKKTFKARILDELSTLDDEVPSNDMAGLHSLAITLLHLGDDEAAGVILAVLFMPLKALRGSEHAENTDDDEVQKREDVADEDENDRGKSDTNDDKDYEHDWEEIEVGVPEGGADASSDCPAATNDGAGHEPVSNEDNRKEAPQLGPTSDTDATLDVTANHVEAVTTNGETRLALSLDIAWIHECNSPCSTSYHDYTSLHVCKICLGVKFCGECLQLVKEEQLVCRTCSPQHTWYQAWPIPEGKAEMAAEPDGERWIIRKEWLERLREEWL